MSYKVTKTVYSDIRRLKSMTYKVIKTVPSISDLIIECTPCHGDDSCIGPDCKLYQVAKFLDMSCAYLFYDQTDKVIKLFKGDIDIEVIGDTQEPEDSQESKDSQESENNNHVNINLSSSTPNKNASFTSKDATIVNLTGKKLMVNLKKDKKIYNTD